MVLSLLYLDRADRRQRYRPTTAHSAAFRLARRCGVARRDDDHARHVCLEDPREENWWANDIDGSALAAQPGKSQGRPLKSPGSNSPIVQNGRTRRTPVRARW
jgi:hypothetical protein